MTMNALTFISKIENGKTTCSAAIVKALRSFEGRVVSISIKKYVKQRSLPQHKYYMGVVIPHIVMFELECGNITTKEAVHKYCKDHFLPPMGVEQVNVLGDVVERRSTRLLDTKNWEIYMEAIRAHLAKFGCVIPMPREGWL